jgi:chromate transporter
MIYIRLYINFFMTGMFSIGGGLATLPFLYDMAARTGWFTNADIADMLAVSESTPGAIGINMATYCGYTAAGIPGDIIATLGLITPGIIIIMIISKILSRFRNNRYVDWAFYGLKAASIGLIANAGLSVISVTLLKSSLLSVSMTEWLSLISWNAVILAAVIFAGMKLFKKVHPIFFIIFSAVIGVIFSFAGV